MPLLDGPSLGGNARHVLRQYAEENALARGRAANAAGTEEFGGGCLRGRYNNLREVIQNNPSLVVVPSIINAGSLFVQRPICRTNYLPNNSMAGATGSVLPTTWTSGSIPAGFTFSVGASGQATANDGTVVNYVDVSVSGTATASGTFNLFFSAATGAVTATTGQTFTLSAYATCISGDITTPAMVLQLQEVSGSTFQAGTSTNIALASGAVLQRLSAVRTFNQSGVTAARGRIGHPIVSGTTYSYTIRIASPQLERLGVATPMIATSTGAVTRLNESTNVVGIPPDFTVSRNTTATRVNSSGLIESVASGVPRLDWYATPAAQDQPATGCPALMVEPSATNLCRYSEQFNTVTSGWSATALQPITGNTNATLDPAGGNTADLIVATTTSGVSHKIFSNTNNFPSFVSGTAYTLSVFAKATSTTSGFVQIAMGGNDFSPALPFANFQLSGNGAVTTGTYSAATIQSFGNGWYRCSLTATAVASGTAYTGLFVPILASGTTRDGNFTGNGVDGVYLWGAQLETGSVATTYIPTTVAAASRAADVISASGALVSGLIGQTEGTIYAEVDVRSFASSTSRALFYISDGSMLNYIRLEYQFVSPRYILVVSLVQAGVTIYQKIATTGTDVVNGTIKIAFGYSSGNNEVFQNGAILSGNVTGLGTYASLTGLSKLNLGSRGTDLNQFNDRIRAAALYTTRLTDAQLAELTRL